ncbi:hypothetical protein K2173_021854 [Erythroxylum novogranatense]|uniref:Rab-GAP TBC domain-containing protein n=1 Tax=Erythroxylum novogranatense TaxID=1862640 RepID=A0AAV8T355_9ROSI|nr:hypothetical protein K2173_021854 [Erythroxylum novogranatense]
MFNPNNGHISGSVGSAGAGGLWWAVATPTSRVTVAVTALAGLAVFAAIFYTTNRGHIKSPWSSKKRKHALSPDEWRSLFTPDGKFCDGGVKFLKRVRSGGVDPSIRAEVWPFLLGVYDLNSSREEREALIYQKRKEYEKLRRQCQDFLKHSNQSSKVSRTGSTSHNVDDGDLLQGIDSSGYEMVTDRASLSLVERESDKKEEARKYVSSEAMRPEDSNAAHSQQLENDHNLRQDISSDVSAPSNKSSDSDPCEVSEVIQASSSSEDKEVNDLDVSSEKINSPSMTQFLSDPRTTENFDTWQRIIRVDAVRANAEWVSYAPSQAAVSMATAHRLAEAVGLKDYDHLEPCRIFHAARLVAILEAYAIYDPEIGYCQGMSDLLSPLLSVISEDHDAFWCFVGFMRKARHNFRLDELGIRRQLNIVSKIIKCKDSRLYRHLEKLQAEDCFFVYRMVVVLFRRELTFEQTLCLWEVVWADQAAIRTGIAKSAWSRIRQQAPPTDDLLLYAIAASVLQRRKLIIEMYSSMDEILRECNSMAGQLDVWKLLDDAHDLVVTLYDKIESPL